MAQNPRTDDAASPTVSGRNSRLTRRSYVRSLATAAAATAALGAVGTAAAADYEVIEANGQTIDVAGETFENVLLDVSNGNGVSVLVGDDATVRNVGVTGVYRGDGFIFAIDGGGAIEFENIYVGDGATMEGSDHAHGPGAVFYHKGSTADVTFTECNVQGYTNNGFYCSNSETGGKIVWERCFGKNNGVSTFRGAGGDEIRNCVAYNDDTDYGDGYDLGWTEANGRPVWAWSSETLEIYDSEFDAGTYGGALFTHEGGHISMQSGAVAGETDGSVDLADDVGTDPALSIPEGVPESAEDAAAGN